MPRVLPALLCLIGLAGAHSVSAASLKYTFSANTFLEIRGSQLANPEQSFFTPGTLVSGSFDYDSEGPLLQSGPGGSIYGSVSNFAGSVAGQSFFDPSGFSVVLNNGLDLDPNDPDNPLVDFLAIAADGGPDVTLNGFAVENEGNLFDLINVRLFWFSPQGDFLADESLPEMPSVSSEIARMALDFVDRSNPGITHTVFAEPLVVTPVPAPAALWLFGTALCALGWPRRR